MILLAWLACTDDPPTAATTADTATTDGGAVLDFTLRVTLDGAPAPDVTVFQPGTALSWTTGPDGAVKVSLDPDVEGGPFVVAMHPDARIRGSLPPDTTEMTLALSRFDRTDNEDYVFQDPGTPDRRDTTDQCSHCHVTMGDDWWASPHRTAASNPAVHDLYAGTSAALDTAQSCADAGGAWLAGVTPGTGAPTERCYLGGGALPALNPACAPSCDTDATTFGGCADCHAPGIDGALGGRDLLEARGFAYEGGVHCDVCHKVESVDLDAEPGVAGRLGILRPSEPSTSPTLEWAPLTFGPLPDVPHVRMGSVYRDLFHDPALCAGCHQLDQPALGPGAAVDLARWPDGRIPVHSTYAEWLAGPMNPAAPCTSCHMPPNPTAGNAADLGLVHPDAGLANGWYRPPGAARHHSWDGPRQRESGMLELAASLSVDVATADGVTDVDVTVKNVGPGHAIPTGEPLRAILVLVSAACDGVAQPAVGGDALPDWAGAYEAKDAVEDWTRWESAVPGDVVRVVRRTGGYHDYTGYGPFGDGTFDAAAKGLPVEEVVGEAAVVAVVDGVAAFDRPLPDGDAAYLTGPGAPPLDGELAAPRAGAAGFAFARVLAAADGRRMVPHFEAVDVVSDNRLLPQQSWTSRHSFASSCADPVVTATLVHRAYPWALAAEKRWALVESVMAEVQR